MVLKINYLYLEKNFLIFWKKIFNSPSLPDASSPAFAHKTDKSRDGMNNRL
jgi:hypothetical protein